MEVCMNEIVEVIEPKEECISPEGLEVAEAYLRTWDVNETAALLDMPLHLVAACLKTREVKKYVDTVFMDVGYRNKHKLGSVLDKVIELKMEEMEDAEIGSNKDITEVLALAHKFRMDELKLMLEYEKLTQADKKQEAQTINNVQVNNTPESSNYNNLLTALLEK